MKALLAVLGLMLMAGCAVGENPGADARAQVERDSKALSDLYATVEGRWVGNIAVGGGADLVPAELILYRIFINDGSNPDGSQRLRPTLRGRFRPLDMVTETDDLTLMGDYDKSGRLVLTSVSPQGGVDILLSIEGVAVRDSVTAQIARRGGVWGTYSGARVSRDPSSPGGGDLAERRERLLRIFGEVEGRYRGALRGDDGNDRMVEISMIVSQAPSTSGELMPVLTAQFAYLDVPSGELEWSLSVDYNSQTGALNMRDTGGGTVGVPGGRMLSLVGRTYVVNGKRALDLVVRNRSSVLGKVQATRR